jgi:hypothetical protein
MVDKKTTEPVYVKGLLVQSWLDLENFASKVQVVAHAPMLLDLNQQPRANTHAHSMHARVHAYMYNQSAYLSYSHQMPMSSSKSASAYLSVLHAPRHHILVCARVCVCVCVLARMHT